ncbi:hypothetical protein HK100_007260 [Physocladia obscura]|uniref:Uncharacterized protein n=1 Tax=Physocladia obscura TaxID=109957 RepID=A0AAD5XIB7_9FUNG|nr:hypothetical protein HK100_007260 [Physocladia obscura]
MTLFSEKLTNARNNVYQISARASESERKLREFLKKRRLWWGGVLTALICFVLAVLMVVMSKVALPLEFFTYGTASSMLTGGAAIAMVAAAKVIWSGWLSCRLRTDQGIYQSEFTAYAAICGDLPSPLRTEFGLQVFGFWLLRIFFEAAQTILIAVFPLWTTVGTTSVSTSTVPIAINAVGGCNGLYCSMISNDYFVNVTKSSWGTMNYQFAAKGANGTMIMPMWPEFATLDKYAPALDYSQAEATVGGGYAVQYIPSCNVTVINAQSLFSNSQAGLQYSDDTQTSMKTSGTYSGNSVMHTLELLYMNTQPPLYTKCSSVANIVKVNTTWRYDGELTTLVSATTTEYTDGVWDNSVLTPGPLLNLTFMNVIEWYLANDVVTSSPQDQVLKTYNIFNSYVQTLIMRSANGQATINVQLVANETSTVKQVQNVLLKPLAASLSALVLTLMAVAAAWFSTMNVPWITHDISQVLACVKEAPGLYSTTCTPSWYCRSYFGKFAKAVSVDGVDLRSDTRIYLQSAETGQAPQFSSESSIPVSCDRFRLFPSFGDNLIRRSETDKVQFSRIQLTCAKLLGFLDTHTPQSPRITINRLNKAQRDAENAGVLAIQEQINELDSSDDEDLIEELKGSIDGLLKGASRNIQARDCESSFVSAQIYNLGSAMSQRDGVTQTRDECIDLIISVALDGRVVDGLCETRNEEERAAAYEHLENGDGASCSHCGVKVVWKAGQDRQGTVDRLADGGYFSAFVTMLISKINFKRADQALELYLRAATDDEAKLHGIKRSASQVDYWTKKFENQSKEKREKFKNMSSMMKKRGGKYKTLADIRDYKVEGFLEFCRVMDNCCVVTGIDDEPRSVDCFTRMSHYTLSTIVLLLTRLNDAKEAFPAFLSDDTLAEYIKANKIESAITAIVKVLRRALTRFIAFQQAKRVEVIVVDD